VHQSNQHQAKSVERKVLLLVVKQLLACTSSRAIVKDLGGVTRYVDITEGTEGHKDHMSTRISHLTSHISNRSPQLNPPTRAPPSPYSSLYILKYLEYLYFDFYANLFLIKVLYYLIIFIILIS